MEQNNFFRIELLDFFRGLALIGMFFFHFLWNLNYFSVVSISLYEGFFGIFQTVVLFSFVFISGISFVLFFNKNKTSKIKFKSKLIKHLFVLGISSLLITIFTLIFFNSSPILFGVLHFILFSWIFGMLFLKLPKFSFILGLSIILLPSFISQNIFSSHFLFFVGPKSIFSALDFTPLIPWFGVFLFGMFFGNKVLNYEKVLSKINLPKALSFVSFIGKRSLFFYLFHQFVLFPLAFLVSLLI